MQKWEWKLKHPSERRMLRKAFLDSRNAEDASDHAIAVGRVCLPWLVDWLDHSRAKVRQAALRSLQRFAEVETNQEAICDMIVQKMASLKVGRAEPPHSPRLFALAEGAELLAAMNDYRARPILYEHLEGPSAALAASAAAQLAALKETRAANAIGSTLIDWEKAAEQPWRRSMWPILLSIGGIYLLFSGIQWSPQNAAGNSVDDPAAIIFRNAAFCLLIAWIARNLIKSWGHSSVRQWPNTRTKFTSALLSLDTTLAIGPLALCTEQTALREMAIASLEPLLTRVKRPEDAALTAEQSKALSKLLDVENDGFRRALINALAFIGDEQSLAALKRFAKDKRRPEGMKELAAQAAAALQLRLSGRSDERVLLRATDPEHEQETLLRSADGDYEFPSDQLLRQANPES